MQKRTLLTALLVLLFASLVSGVFAVCYTASGFNKLPSKPGVSSADSKRFTADIFVFSPNFIGR